MRHKRSKKKQNSFYVKSGGGSIPLKAASTEL